MAADIVSIELHDFKSTTEETNRQNIGKEPRQLQETASNHIENVEYRNGQNGPSRLHEEHPTILRQRNTNMEHSKEGIVGGEKRKNGSAVVPEDEDPLDRPHASGDDTFDNIQVQLDVIKSLREQSWTMSKKLETLRAAKHIVQEYTVKLSKMDLLRESRIRLFRRLKRQIANFIVFFIPWEKRIRNIQGHFGAGIGSFFLFLRSLVWVNTVMFIFTTIFVIAPQLISPSTSTKMPEELIPSAMYLTSILDAKGSLEYSFLFYGYYGNRPIQVGSVRYPLPLAYMIVFLGTYLFSVFTILRAMAQEQNNSKSSGEHDQYKFGWRVFTAWDFLITEKETAENKVASITTTIKEQILEEVEQGKEENIHLLRFLRVLANFLVICVLAGSGFAIYWVVKRSDERNASGVPPTILEQYEISLAMTGLNLICPSLFVIIGMMEKYHPRTALYWELTRIMVMYLGNLYVLLISLLNMINESKQSVTTTLATNSTTILQTTLSSNAITTISPNHTTVSVPSPTNCWETVVGQELLKVSVIDLIFLVFGVITGELFVALIVRFFNCCPGRMLDLENVLGYPEFKLAENVLQLINSQGLIWIGMVFSPGIIMVNLVKSIIIMYLRSWAVMVTNVPPKRIFKASHQFYLVLLLLMLFLCLLAVGYAIVEIEPSKGCGPFRGKRRMYVVVTEAVDNAPAVVNSVLDYLSGPSVIIPIIIIMGIAISYYRSKASSYRKMNRDLVIQLQYERTEDRKRQNEITSGPKDKKKGPKTARSKPPQIAMTTVGVDDGELRGWKSVNSLVSSGLRKQHAQRAKSIEMLPTIRDDVIPNGHPLDRTRMPNGYERKPLRKRRREMEKGKLNPCYTTSSANDDKIDIMVHRDHAETNARASNDQRTNAQKHERNVRRREFHHYRRNHGNRKRHDSSSDVQADDSDTDIQIQSFATATSGTSPTESRGTKSNTFSVIADQALDSHKMNPLYGLNVNQSHSPSKPSEDRGGSLGDMFGNDLQEDLMSNHSNVAYEPEDDTKL